MFIPLSTIVVEEGRHRTKARPDHLERLANSLMDVGQLHPIGVKPDGEGKWVLQYGECRMLAMLDLLSFGVQVQHGVSVIPLGSIAAIDLGDLDRLKSKETELAENVERENLNWDEEIRAMAEIHKLREEQASERGEKQTMADTAREIMPRISAESPTKAVATISRALIVHEHLEDPDIAKAKSSHEAFKLVEKKLERLHLVNRGQELAKVQVKSRHRLLLGDARDLLATIPDASIDILLTDPPYGVEAHGFGEQVAKEAHFDDSYEYWQQLMADLALQSWRITKPEAHAYIFCDIQNFKILSNIFGLVGWYIWPWPLIWHKSGSNGTLPRPDHGPRRMYESILYCIKGDRKTLRVDGDILSIAPPRDSPHPHAKPFELYANLASRSARPGDTILDPFAGTAPLLEVAERQHLTAICIEKDPGYFALAQTRLAAL